MVVWIGAGNAPTEKMSTAGLLLALRGKNLKYCFWNLKKKNYPASGNLKLCFWNPKSGFWN